MTARAVPDEPCPVCHVVALVEVKCKVVCTNCRTIVQSCADAQHDQRSSSASGTA
jgi:hypothetical protein